MHFKELQVLKPTWCDSIVNQAIMNSQEVLKIFLQEYWELYELKEERRNDANDRDIEVFEHK